VALVVPVPGVVPADGCRCLKPPDHGRRGRLCPAAVHAV